MTKNIFVPGPPGAVWLTSSILNFIAPKLVLVKIKITTSKVKTLAIGFISLSSLDNFILDSNIFICQCQEFFTLSHIYNLHYNKFIYCHNFHILLILKMLSTFLKQII